MANECLKRTPTSTGNRKKWTWAGWIKINKDFGSSQYNTVWSVAAGTSSDNSDRFHLYHYSDGRWGTTGTTSMSAVFTGPGGSAAHSRDSGSWMHICLSVDTTISSLTPDKIQRFWINGMEYIYDDVGNISQNADLAINGPYEHIIGRRDDTSLRSTDGQMFDLYLVDGQALTPDVFGFYKDGDGYQSSGTTQATDFRPGQWSPRLPKSIKHTINRSGGFGVNGFYLPMNDSSNPGADFHCAPNSIIKLKGEDLPQPQNGAPTTSDAFVSQLRPEKEGTLGFDGCVRFDGTDDRLEIANNIDLELGSSDFCMEAFIFASELKNAGIFGNNQSSPSPSGYEFDIFSSGAITFYSGNGSAYSNTGGNLGTISSAGVIKTGRWHHVAAVRNGNTLRLYVDGNKVAENTSFSHTIADTTNTHQIGCDGISSGSSFHFNGLISNARLVKGSPVYTANFTPPTEPLTAITNTKLLCCQSSTDATAATVTPGTITTNGNTFATKNEILGSMVLAVPGASTATGATLITNGTFDSSDLSDWTTTDNTQSWNNGQLQINRSGGGGATSYQAFTTEAGKRYTVKGTVNSSGSRGDLRIYDGTGFGGTLLLNFSGTNGQTTTQTGSFTASSTTSTLGFSVDNNSTTIYVDNVVVKQEDAPRDYSADIKGSGTNKTLTPVGDAGVGYELGGYYGSAMTFDSSGDYIDISESNTEYDLDGDYTIECWVNFNSINSVNDIIGTANNSVYLGSGKGGWVIGYASFSNIGFRFGYQNNSSWVFEYSTGITAVANQWYHVAISHSGSTQQIIINGVVVHTATQTNTLTSTENVVRVGGGFGSTSGLLNGQIQDFRIYNGVAKYKGGFDVPKPYTPVGIEAFRTTADTCKNNFATLSPLSYQTTGTYGTSYPVLSNGNLTFTHGMTGQWERTNVPFGVGEGKWYYEFQIVTRPNFVAPDKSENWAVGVRESDSSSFYGESDGFEDLGDHVYWIDAGTAKIVSNEDRTAGATSGISSVVNGDIINIAFEKTATELKVWFGKNGTYFNSGNPSSGTTPAVNHSTTSQYIIPAAAFYRYTGGQVEPVGTFNFGQNPSFSGALTAGTNADDSGKGLFKYAPPTGFLALCEDNLPTPTIADPGKHFKTVLYTGKGSTGTDGSQSIRKVGFQPDLVWVKKRSTAGDHKLVDSVRGSGKVLESNTADQENDESNNFTGFNFDGFDLGANNAGAWNENGYGYVAWCWKAGGPAVSNTDGTITSQVSANQTAGFSIISYTGNGTAGANVGHGLLQAPELMIHKSRDQNRNWYTITTTVDGSPDYLYLNLNNEANDSAVTAPTSSLMYFTSSVESNNLNEDYIAYCWHSVEGFSKFGSYVGNNDDDGPFVYCGFKPAWVMIKQNNDNNNWHIADSSRKSINPVNMVLRANVSNEESENNNSFNIDFLSNGFKLRSTNDELNENTSSYIFAAFAESPFQTANAK